MSIAGALSNDVRIEVLSALMEAGGGTAEELAEQTGHAMRTIDQHLKVLVESGLVIRPGGEQRYVVLADAQTILDPLLFPQRTGHATSPCKVFESREEFQAHLSRINERLGRKDVNYYLYNGDELEFFLDWIDKVDILGPKQLAQRGVDMRVITTVTEENMSELRRLSQWFDIRHAPENILDFRFIIKGEKDVFFWFTRRNPKDPARGLCAWFSGEDFQKAFYSVFMTLWIISTRLPERIKELKSGDEDE